MLVQPDQSAHVEFDPSACRDQLDHGNEFLDELIVADVAVDHGHQLPTAACEPHPQCHGGSPGAVDVGEVEVVVDVEHVLEMIADTPFCTHPAATHSRFVRGMNSWLGGYEQ